MVTVIEPTTPHLYPQQIKVLTEVAKGGSLNEVAVRMGIPRTQVASRLSEAYRRFSLDWLPRDEKREEAIRLGRKYGLIPD